MKKRPTVFAAKQGKVFKIELNRPGKFNAITWQMYEGLFVFCVTFIKLVRCIQEQDERLS
jgi:enoyl-CoA hydratase/carnithine racemase